VTATDPLAEVLVVSGPEQVLSAEAHEDGTVETVSVRPVLVYAKQPDGSLIELFGEEKRAALSEFWASAEVFRAEDGRC
jgi:hypothetical protein